MYCTLQNRDHLRLQVKWPGRQVTLTTVLHEIGVRNPNDEAEVYHEEHECRCWTGTNLYEIGWEAPAGGPFIPGIPVQRYAGER